MRRKYGLAPTDPRFLAMTPEDCEVEFWAHHYADQAGEGGEEYEDDDFDLAAVLQEAAGSGAGGDLGALASSDEWEDVING